MDRLQVTSGVWPAVAAGPPATVLGATAVALAILSLMLGACATVGHDFPTDRVSQIHQGQTTQEEIRALFGEPWRTGIEDGRRTWTYAKYRYKLFGQVSTTDLVLRFDDQGKVVSYTFNTTERDR
jgi:hypothetical protein